MRLFLGEEDSSTLRALRRSRRNANKSNYYRYEKVSPFRLSFWRFSVFSILLETMFKRRERSFSTSLLWAGERAERAEFDGNDDNNALPVTVVWGRAAAITTTPCKLVHRFVDIFRIQSTQQLLLNRTHTPELSAFRCDVFSSCFSPLALSGAFPMCFHRASARASGVSVSCRFGGNSTATLRLKVSEFVHIRSFPTAWKSLVSPNSPNRRGRSSFSFTLWKL